MHNKVILIYTFSRSFCSTVFLLLAPLLFMRDLIIPVKQATHRDQDPLSGLLMQQTEEKPDEHRGAQDKRPIDLLSLIATLRENLHVLSVLPVELGLVKSDGLGFLDDPAGVR
jgi:hypothetical protein